MGIFDNFKEINGKIEDDSWIEWLHFLIPNKENWLRTLLRSILACFGHCLNCTALDGCYFVKWNMPKNKIPNSNGLLHPNCDCQTQDISLNKVRYKSRADCQLSKFTNYVFGENSKGKKALFESWGFSIEDSEYLVNMYCTQAIKNYLSGNYVLKNLDEYGQRLAIPITLKGNIMFYSGWMVHPEGLITNTTPYAGEMK